MTKRVHWVLPCLLSAGLFGCIGAPSMPEMPQPRDGMPPVLSDRELEALLKSLLGRTIDLGRRYEAPPYSCQCIRQVRPNAIDPPVECPNPPCFTLESEQDFRDGMKVLEAAFDAYKRGERLEVRPPSG